MEPHLPLSPGIGKREHDFYGFPLEINDEDRMIRERCLKRERKQARKWDRYEERWDRTPRHPEGRLKKLIRKGIPPHLRGRLWLEVSGGAHKQEQSPTNYYNSLLGAQDGVGGVITSRPDDPVAMQIELDLGRTFPNNQRVDCRLGRTSLQRVLLAYARHNPEVGYCQSMNYVAAMLLLVLESEEKAFWVLAALLDERLYKHTYSSNLSGCQVEIRTLGRLVEQKLPKLAAHLKATGTEMTFVATEWVLCMFSRTFPAETTARVWDAVLSEGPKVLHRVALAVLKLHQPALLAAGSTGEIVGTLQSAARRMQDRDALMKAAFHKIGPFPMKRIARLRVQEQIQVDAEMTERERRRAENSRSGGDKSHMYAASAARKAKDAEEGAGAAIGAGGESGGEGEIRPENVELQETRNQV